MSTLSIAVVVPYYQREAQLLRRALESIVAQSFPAEQVVVVDDGSPSPLREELKGGDFERRLHRLTLVQQTNQGVSAARNAGLAHLADDINAIAFLDSDDVWQPNHLASAARAFALGADFFFSNFHRSGLTEDAFTEPGRRHLQAPDGPLIRWTQGVGALMRSACPIMTSSVVYRRSILPHLRFTRRYRRAGEDHIAFWQLCLHASCIMYSTEATWTYGDEGVGTWRNCAWGTYEHLVMLTDEIRLLHHVARRFPVSSDAEAQICAALSARRLLALSTTLHLVRRHRNVYGELVRLFCADPRCAVTWAATFPTYFRSWVHSRPH
jgi:succinoglycan biosynthesis protein ExoW